MELWVNHKGRCRRELVIIKSNQHSLLVFSDRFLYDLSIVGYRGKFLLAKDYFDTYSILLERAEGFILFITNLRTKETTSLSTTICQQKK